MLREKKHEITRSKMNGVERNCTIFLGYTSNMASCGVRDTIRFLVQHKADLSGNIIIHVRLKKKY